MTRHKSSPMLLVSLAIITLISSVAANIGTAHAASSVLLYSDMDTNQKIISYEFYKSLSSCVDDTDYSATRKSIFTVSDSILNNAKSVMGIGSAAEIDAEIVKTPTTSNTDIFVQIFNHSKTNGYNIGLQAEATAKKNGAKVGDSTNGIVSCEEIAKAAYSFWALDSKGLNGIYSMLSAMGFKSSYNPEADNGYVFWSISTKPAFSDYIKSEIYGGKDIVLDDGLQYYLYKYYFFEKIGCGATVYTAGDNLYVGGTSFSGAQYATVKASLFKEGSKSVLEKTYKLNKTTMEVGNTNIPIHFETSKTCSEIASSLTKMTEKIDKEKTYDKYVANIKDAENEIKEKTEASQENAGDLSDSTKTSCSINGIGWIVCPVVNFMAEIADSAFKFLSNSFLNINPKLFDTTESTYTAWSAVRSLANVAFAIAFLVIIYSQMSGFGISNYGVKKMLPRLIIAAILVNVSYFLCQIAIDVSNILGGSIKSFLDSLIPQATTESGTSDWTSQGNLFTGMVTAVITTGIIWATLAAIMPVLLAAVVALMMIFFILVARQVLVILLVVIAPLAFVAYLLPNTNQYFKKWQKTFTAMLMLFPIIAFVFGMSNLASAIISGAFTSDSTSGISKEMGEVIAAAVLVLPLFVVPSLLKKSLNGVGNLGATINGIGSKISGAANQQFQKSNPGQYLKYRDSQRELGRINAQTGIYKGRNPYRRVISAINSGANTALKTGVGGKLLKNFAMSAESRGKSLLDKGFEDEIIMATTSQKGLGSDSLKAIATGKIAATEAERTAAIRSTLKIGNYEDRKEVYKSVGENGTTARQKKSIEEGFFAKGDNQFFGASFAAEFAKENAKIDDTILSNAIFKNTKNITAKTLVDNAPATKDIFEAINRKPETIEDQKNIDAVINNANSILRQDSPLHGDVSAEKKTQLDNIINLGLKK